MDKKLLYSLIMTLNSWFFCVAVSAQTAKASGAGLFDNDSTLKITLSGNLRDLMTDVADNSQNHPVVISYTQNGKEVSLNADAKTRGHFRRTMGNCTYPPLLLQFTNNDALSSSIFKGQDK